MTEASVSFLGFGDPTSVSWGMMLQDAFSSQALSRGQYAWFVPPGLCIILVVVAGFFISRGYEEVFLPRLRGRWRSLLAVEDLQIHYATRDGVARAVDGAHASHVPEGKIVGLVGESGCGKTTAVRAIMGVLPRERPARRRASRVQGPSRSTTGTRRPLLWREIAYVPQSAMSSLDPVYTRRRADRRGADQARRRLARSARRRARPSCSTWWA